MPLMQKPATTAPWPPVNSPGFEGRFAEPVDVTKDPKESFWTVIDKAKQIYPDLALFSATDLVRFNFRTNKPEEINWYLKNYVGCVTATEDNLNYRFKGTTYKPQENKGVIFLPLKNEVVFEDPTPIRVIRKKAGEIRWIQFSSGTTINGGPNYMIPGVDLTSEPIKADGSKASKGEAIAALVQFVATTGSNWIASQATQSRLSRMEADFMSDGGGGAGQSLQPNGPNEAVIVLVFMLKSTAEDAPPPTPYGQPIMVGPCNLKDAGSKIEKDLQYRTPLSSDKSQVIYPVYYVGTRLGPDGRL